jgi:ATP-dependent Clp protease ATP-binding subunit ClpA
MFERFHPDARAAIERAKVEATRSGQADIGTEHLLLGLLARPGHAADALTAAGADAVGLRTRIAAGAPAVGPEPPDADTLAPGGSDLESAEPASDAAVGAAKPDRVCAGQRDGRDVIDGMPMTREAKRTLELALRAAQRLRHQHVSSGHVLLGIIDQPGTPGVEALSVAGIHVGTLRADVLRRMSSGPDVG